MESTGSRAQARPLDPPLGVTEWPVPPERLLHPGHTALLVLDMQRRFLEPGSKGRASGVVEAVQRLLESARGNGVPRFFVHVREYDPRFGRTGGYRMKLASITSGAAVTAQTPPSRRAMRSSSTKSRRGPAKS